MKYGRKIKITLSYPIQLLFKIIHVAIYFDELDAEFDSFMATKLQSF